MCKRNQQTVYGVGRQESARIMCHVDANPEEDLQFRWKFNNSAETLDIPPSNYDEDGTRSTLTYSPMTEHDYGTVLCWASHEATGKQKTPCVYHIIPAGIKNYPGIQRILRIFKSKLYIMFQENRTQ